MTALGRQLRDAVLRAALVALLATVLYLRTLPDYYDVGVRHFGMPVSFDSYIRCDREAVSTRIRLRIGLFG